MLWRVACSVTLVWSAYSSSFRTAVVEIKTISGLLHSIVYSERHCEKYRRLLLYKKLDKHSRVFLSLCWFRLKTQTYAHAP